MPAKFAINVAFLIAGYFIEKWMERQPKRVQSHAPAFFIFGVPSVFFLWQLAIALWEQNYLYALFLLLPNALFAWLISLMIKSMRMKHDIIVDIAPEGFTIRSVLTRDFEPWSKVSAFSMLGDHTIRYDMLGARSFRGQVAAQREIPEAAVEPGQLGALCNALNAACERAWMRAA